VTSTRTPLSYYWNNVSGSTTKSGINGGKFVFKVRDNRGCIKQDSVLLDTVKVLTATKNFKQGTCNVNNAYIKIKATGGTGAYSYTWSHTTSNVDSVYNLSPGTYKITVSDAKGCQWFDSVTIVQLGMPNVTFNKTPARCRNANGSIDAILSNFSGTYSYLWSSGETTSLITGKSANNYSLTISDGAGCTMSASTTLTTIGVDSISLEIKQPICDINNGKIKAVPMNIAGNKTYSWSTGANIDSIINLGGGNFSLTVTDSFCTYSKSTTLVMAKSPLISLSKVNATCGLNNGRVLTSVTFGASPFVYTWNTGSNFPNLFNVDSGTYTVIISDTNNCKDTATIYVPRIPKLAASFVTTNTTCGNSNGSIQTTVTGGTPGYTYNWSNGNNLANLSNLLAGTYTLTLNDNGNCTIVETVVLTDKKKPDIDSVVTNAVCSKSNGSIIINIIDGTAPFTYKWNTGATSKDLLNLSSGFYSLTVVDSIGCRDSSLILVDNGATPSLSYLEVKNSTCGLSNGRIAVELPRGISPITYTWSTGVSNDTLDNIPAGKYYITVLDGRQCEIIDTVTITTSTNPIISLSSSAAYCSQAKGSITSSIINGTPKYKFIWSNGDTSQNPTSLFSGNYSVTVVDSFLCKDTASIFVNEKKNDLTASVQLFNLKCFNDLSGKVIITPMGGTPPYLTYDVNSPAPDSIVYNLSAKKYIYSVYDSLGCQYTDSFTLTEPNPLSTILVSKQDLLCYKEPSGGIRVKTNGGTAPFTYIWSSGAVGDDVTGLSAGVHTVSVTDINGCKDNYTTTISQPNDIIVNETIVNNPCNGLAAGTINLNVSSGTAPYSFAWSNGFSNKDISGLSQGRYKVSITDANNCLDTFSYTLLDPDKLQLGSVSTIGLKCKEFIDGEITVNGIGGTLPYKYSLDSGKTFNYNNRFTDLNSGNYYIIIKDNNGCKSFVNATVSTYPEFTIRAYPRDTQINLGENVTLGYNVIQGSDLWIKSTLWSDGEGLSCVDCRNPISSGYFEKIYVVEVKYFDKCKVTDSVMIRIVDTNGLFVPSAFAPESAEKDENRTFRVYANKLLSASISIYNRWGEKVFESKEAHIKGWDGMYKGQPAPSSVYSYVLEVTYLSKRKVVKKGTVTLIR